MKEKIIIPITTLALITGLFASCGGTSGDDNQTPTEDSYTTWDFNTDSSTYSTYTNTDSNNYLSICNTYPCAWLERASDNLEIPVNTKSVDFDLEGFVDQLAWGGNAANYTIYQFEAVNPSYLNIDKLITLPDVHGFFIPSKIQYGSDFYYPSTSEGILRKCNYLGCENIIPSLTNVSSVYVKTSDNSLLILANNGTLYEYYIGNYTLIKSNYDSRFRELGIHYANNEYILLASSIYLDAIGIAPYATLEMYLLNAETFEVINSFEVPQEDWYVKSINFNGTNWFVLTENHLYKFDENLNLISQIYITEGVGMTSCGNYLYITTGENLLKVDPNSFTVVDTFQLKEQYNQYLSPDTLYFGPLNTPTCINGILLLPSYGNIYFVSASQL